MPLTNFKSDLTSYLKKLAGVHAVGELWWHYDPKSKPAGVQLFSGQLLSREAYTDHWTLVFTKRTVVTEEEWQAMVAKQGFCQFYSSGDGSTTYRFPLIKGVHPKFVAALAEAGQYVQAGLPNITGSSGNGIIEESKYDPTGAFYRGVSNNTAIEGVDMFGSRLGFDASRSNPIYGNSDTVQPPAVSILIGEYVIGTITEIGEADAESLLASVTTLESNVGALEQGSGFSTEGKALLAGLGMPSERKTSWALGASGTTYTMPANGYLYIDKTAGKEDAYVLFRMLKISSSYEYTSAVSNSYHHCTLLMPVRKNDQIKVEYSANGATHAFMFIYAEGED